MPLALYLSQTPCFNTLFHLVVSSLLINFYLIISLCSFIFTRLVISVFLFFSLLINIHFICSSFFLHISSGILFSFLRLFFGSFFFSFCFFLYYFLFHPLLIPNFPSMTLTSFFVIALFIFLIISLPSSYLIFLL